MAIFGRMTARQRLRRATRESLAMPAFSSPIDCTPWVIGGLWPAELSTITAENATVADYLKTDLQRIVDGANEQLKMIKRAGLADLPRQAEEARVIDEARARAVRRVESTIRQLHAVPAGATAGYARPQFAEPPAPDMDRTQVIPAVTEAGPPDASRRRPRWRVVEKPAPVAPEGAADEPEAVPQDTAPEYPDMEETQVIPSVTEVERAGETPSESATEPAGESVANGRRHIFEQQDDAESAPEPPTADATALEETQVIPAITDVEPAVDEAEPAAIVEEDTPAGAMEETQVIPAITDVEPVVDEPAWEPIANGRHHAEPDEPATGQDEAQPPEPVADVAAAAALDETQVIPAITDVEPVVDEPADTGRHHAVVDEPAGQEEPAPHEPLPRPAPQKAAPATGFDINRLNRLLEFVVRQEPRLNWAVGERADGTTVLVTDLAHGWIPAGINLPGGVRLLEPGRRTGRVAALLGDAAHVVTYAPGDSLRRSADFTATKSSLEPRELPAIPDLARVLSQTTRGFEGLPRIVQRLADTAAADAVVIDQEVDVLRVHLDTARYQLLVQSPSVNPALLLKCLLMAATEGIASADPVSANYHLAWYQKLATEPTGA
ncbi:DUF5632 domain-containing protein [Mycobacterium sp. E3339]|uniref:DUF5632 domain-containing protein n=1 Tax=Mycobacterium sp. E3339 TaxID=1834146 RepID=UPI0007FCF526|nr:DUF5632 domain-containing protein [Mycobacterium sp. E3339]OBG57970.1 hypothetical protein A5702_09200 [Mycobacterium sp. E3339]